MAAFLKRWYPAGRTRPGPAAEIGGRRGPRWPSELAALPVAMAFGAAEIMVRDRNPERVAPGMLAHKAAIRMDRGRADRQPARAAGGLANGQAWGAAEPPDSDEPGRTGRIRLIARSFAGGRVNQ